MKLEPIRPPGRRTRKARLYEQEMRRLQAAGYTQDAIQEALALVGVRVSKSTVQRELARPLGVQVIGSVAAPAATPPVHSTTSGAPIPSPKPNACAPNLASTPQSDPRHGRDVAEEFFGSRATNPLIRRKDTR